MYVFVGDHSSCFPQGPQFVDIPLEEEDSSDEEYRPDEEDEDETAEEVTTACCSLIGCWHSHWVCLCLRGVRV